jgi:hypothetical protein
MRTSPLLLPALPSFSMYSPPPAPCILSHSQCTVLPLYHAFCRILNVQSSPCTMHSATFPMYSPSPAPCILSPKPWTFASSVANVPMLRAAMGGGAEVAGAVSPANATCSYVIFKPSVCFWGSDSSIHALRLLAVASLLADAHESAGMKSRLVLRLLPGAVLCASGCDPDSTHTEFFQSRTCNPSDYRSQA